MNFNQSKSSFNLPWFMFDIDNAQLIVSSTTPGEISDTKDVFLAETPIPGQNFQPITYGGGGNRKISFTLPLMKRNNTVGNLLLLKQFDNLRNQATMLTGMYSDSQFKPNPKVLYNWGLGSLPLVYKVKKADFVHPEHWTNQIGNPQYTLIHFELWLDETNPLYQAEKMFRSLASLAGMASSLHDTVQEKRTGRSFI